MPLLHYPCLQSAYRRNAHFFGATWHFVRKSTYGQNALQTQYRKASVEKLTRAQLRFETRSHALEQR